MNAHLTRKRDGTWYVWVAVSGVTHWPKYAWPSAHDRIPTLAERDKALAALGYHRTTKGWDWAEYEDDDGYVQIYAVADVKAGA